MTQRIVEPLQEELILEDDETLVNISNEIDEGTQQQAAQAEETAQPKNSLTPSIPISP